MVPLGVTLVVDYVNPKFEAKSAIGIHTYEVFKTPVACDASALVHKLAKMNMVEIIDPAAIVFLPHVNITPWPTSYSFQYEYKYGKLNPPQVLPEATEPLGINMTRNMFAGYDLEGRPFYVPKWASIPKPSGFTCDGIPFYDLSCLMAMPGKMITKDSFQIIGEEWFQSKSTGFKVAQDDKVLDLDDSKSVMSYGHLSATEGSTMDKTWVANLIAEVKDSHPILAKALINSPMTKQLSNDLLSEVNFKL